MTVDLADLRSVVGEAGPFVTIGVPTPSNVDDAHHRFAVNSKNVLGEWPVDWPSEELDAVAALVGSLSHDGGEALIVVKARGGALLAEFLDEPLRAPFLACDPQPRLAAIIESRQRARPHIVVETDRAGADLHVFDGGRVVGTEIVDGDTLHIHRGHPGGWSQRRYQQRAENTWERNADDVASAVARADARVHAEIVFVAGDVRAQSLVLDALPHRVRAHTVKVDVGSIAGIADEVVRRLADHVAREIRDLADHLRSRLEAGTATVQHEEVLAALDARRVEHLLVHDDGTDHGLDGGARLVDVAIAGALASDAAITIVPDLAVLDGPVAALLRW